MTESSDMTHQPRVSVVIIFFNAEKFLREAIESVLAQSYKSWELLLVDDGSTDGSSRIASHYSERHHNRIRRLQHPRGENRGMCASRNLGIERAAGKYLAFLDADDVWLPNKLQEQVAILEAHPEAGMLYGRTLYWLSWNSDSSRHSRDFVPALGVPSGKVQPPPDLLPKFLRGSASVPGTCSILVKRKIACKVGGFEESFTGLYSIYEDQAFYSKVCLRTPILALDRCWDKYRQHRESSVAVAAHAGLESVARQFFLEWLQNYLTDRKVENPEVWFALRRELWLLKHPAWSRKVPVARSALRRIKKWTLRAEGKFLPTFLERRIWLTGGLVAGEMRTGNLQPAGDLAQTNLPREEDRRLVPTAPLKSNSNSKSFQADVHEEQNSADLNPQSSVTDKRPFQSPKGIRVAIIILSMNQRDVTLQCLASLKFTGALNHRVLLWDNGSSDGTAEAVRGRFPEVFVYANPVNLGVASGRNAAAALAIKLFRPSHLLFLDNDMIVEDGFVEALARPFYTDSRIGQTQAKLRLMADRLRLNDGGGAQISFSFCQVTPVGFGEVDQGQHDRVKECIAGGGSTMIRTDLFQHLGGFDPQFDPFGPEDIDFSLRLRKSGFLALFVPDALAYHNISHTFGKGYTASYARFKVRHWLQLMRRHATRWQIVKFALFGLPYIGVRALLREGKRGNFAAILGLLRGFLDFISLSLRPRERK